MIHPTKKLQALLLATVLAIGSYLGFVVMLKLPVPMWPSFIAV